MQAALAQKSALAMARGADWTSKLIGLEGLLSETAAGKKWEELLTRAQADCTEAIDSLARLTGLLRDQAQVIWRMHAFLAWDINVRHPCMPKPAWQSAEALEALPA